MQRQILSAALVSLAPTWVSSSGQPGGPERALRIIGIQP